MTANIPVTTQRKILKLERRVFMLEQQIVRLRAKHEKEVTKLRADNQKLRNQPIVISEEQQARLRKLHKQLLEKCSQKT